MLLQLAHYAELCDNRIDICSVVIDATHKQGSLMNPAPTGTVRIGYVRALLDYLNHRGLDASRIFEPALLRELDSPSLNERIPLQQWAVLLQSAIAATGDADLPLRVAEDLTPKHWGVFAYVAMTCQTLAQVVVILERYERLIDEANDTRLLIEGSHAALQWLPRQPESEPAFMQLSLASWAVFARRYTEHPELQADVDFTFAPPRDISTYQQIFGGRIRFNQPVTQLRFPLHYLQLPITHHDADTHRVLITQAQVQIAALGTGQSFAEQVRQAITPHLSTGKVNLEHTAALLNLAPRTLQYQLEQDGTHYRHLLDDIRRELACFYLQDPDMALVDVAFLLGYSEQSPFNKAFKRWVGVTPGEYRKQLKN